MQCRCVHVLVQVHSTANNNRLFGQEERFEDYFKNFAMAEETDGRREPEAENSLPEEKFRKLEIEADLRLKEDAIRNVLSPYEGSVMTIQGLLVWENPRRSFVLLLCVNGFVW